MITCGVMIYRLIIWILHMNYWTLSVLQENVIFRARKRDRLQMISLLKIFSWLNWMKRFRSKTLRQRYSSRQFQTFKKFQKPLLDAQKKTNSCWNKKWSYEGQCTEKSIHWEAGKIGQNPYKKSFFLRKNIQYKW